MKLLKTYQKSFLVNFHSTEVLELPLPFVDTEGNGIIINSCLLTEQIRGMDVVDNSAIVLSMRPNTDAQMTALSNNVIPLLNGVLAVSKWVFIPITVESDHIPYKQNLTLYNESQISVLSPTTGSAIKKDIFGYAEGATLYFAHNGSSSAAPMVGLSLTYTRVILDANEILAVRT